MTEVVCLGFVGIGIWWLIAYWRGKRKVEPVVKRPAMPPVAPPRKPTTSRNYGCPYGSQSREMQQKHNDLYDDVLSTLDEVSGLLTARKQSSRSDDSSFDWGGVDYD